MSFLIQFSSNSLLDISLQSFFVLLIAKNKANSKQSQISRSLINFQEEVIIFKEFQVADFKNL